MADVDTRVHRQGSLDDPSPSHSPSSNPDFDSDLRLDQRVARFDAPEHLSRYERLVSGRRQDTRALGLDICRICLPDDDHIRANPPSGGPPLTSSISLADSVSSHRVDTAASRESVLRP